MPSWPHYDDEQIEAVVATLRSGRVNAWTGHDVRAFEQSYAEALGVPHAIAVANGSLTLDIALHCLGVGPGDEVIVTPRSFVASATCVLLRGATPVFADVDRDTQNITPETIAPLITPRTKGIIPVHLAGWPCDMDGIMELAAAHGLWVIEDCAQAHGARIGARHVGTFATFASFSFCQDKIITTGGEGGLLVTSDDALWRAAWSFKDHGKDYDTVFNTDHPPGFRWLHDHVGTNYRLNGLAAAIGRVQLERLEDWRETRAQNAAILAGYTAPLAALRTPMPGNEITHAWYRFYCFVRPERLKPGWDRDRILAGIAERGFPSFSGSCPEIYLEKAFAGRGLGPAERLPAARELGETSLAFLVDPTRTPEDMHALGAAIAEVVTEGTA